MSSKRKIVAFHLLNDRSGSPKVLSQLIKHWVSQNEEVHLYTSKSENGFLTDIKGVNYHKSWYLYRSNPWLRLLFFTTSQFLLLIKMWRLISKNDLIYINTVLPFGAGILGKLKGARVIYHVHEATVQPRILKWFLFLIVRRTARDIINVSQYVQEAHGIREKRNFLVYNAIEKEYLDQVNEKAKNSNPKNVLMVCSLKTYKGVHELYSLASRHPEYSFRLVLNASKPEIDSFFSTNQQPDNLSIFDAQKNLHPFYTWADVVLNLSRPDGWIETFGLTIIEGMAYGLPAIVPPVGGILEVIEEGKSGISVDSRNAEKLSQALKSILSNPTDYRKMSNEALKRIELFSEENMLLQISSIMDGKV